ncbi:MAG: hypothetical protein IJV83_00050 [Clostridia bacterium]|nr:hypothetical protein [Clostridia bacterium]
MAKKQAKKKSSGKQGWKYAAVALAAIVAVGTIFGIVQHVKTKKAEEETGLHTLVTTEYARYALDDDTGLANEEDQSGISTKMYYLLDGLQVVLEKDATVAYQINYYDKNFRFLGVDTFEEDLEAETVEAMKEAGAVYVKIEIIPTEDEDGSVSILEKNGYVKQATVQVSTEEVEQPEEESEETSSEEESAS